ncbi:MAG: preprotein translocase subunit SecA [Anaerolineaceae bacterium 4572_78]|nr:MAG: preprotein translocase subunit SecA [Anaerolineaceae bacterium 4572_78]
MFGRLANVFKKILPNPYKREIKKLMPAVEKIQALEEEMRAKSDEELRQLIADFRSELNEKLQEDREIVAELKEDYAAAFGEERQLIGVELEQVEKALRKSEDKLLDNIYIPVFAAVREASVRTIGLRHYDVQMVGGVLLHQGRVVEMRTGEGKTLVATLPLVLNALVGHGTHLVTPNDYLSKIGVQTVGAIYHFLGLSVAVIQSAGNLGIDKSSFLYDPEYQSSDDRYQNLRPVTRKEAYDCDVTYGTNNEYGFDYLRDNMARDINQKVQRERHYAIIDEVDNILIDEARTPLIISGQAEESSEKYRQCAQLVSGMQVSSDDSVEDKEPDGDYVLDEKLRVAYFTDYGIEKVQRRLGVTNLYDSEHASLLPYLDNALKAYAVFYRDKEYVVQKGEVIIVDDFTGRLMYGRRYSDGLHQAIEAKENLRVQNESFTWASITFQNFFRMYNKLSGMTGTAATEAEEFSKIYKLEVSALPTHVEFRALQNELVEKTQKIDGVTYITYHSPDNSELYSKRVDYPDIIYKDPITKYKAVVQEIKEVSQAGQPVLVGTVAVETSEELSNMLKRAGVKHEVLNAKNHEREAEIITQAGQPGAVTIATNMAGRGVDILLGGNPDGLARNALRRHGYDLTSIDHEMWQQYLAKAQAQVDEDKIKVLELGGLHVIGTERHDARRIDNQLRGRSGRQGDPGSSRFYVSLQDDLMRRFGGSTVSNLMERFGVDDDIPIEANVVSKSIETAQTKVEGHNFDARKHVLEYDDVVNQQREVIYSQRNRVLSSPNLKESLLAIIYDELNGVVREFTSEDDSDEWDIPTLYKSVRSIMPVPDDVNPARWEQITPDEIQEELHEIAKKIYEEKEARIGSEIMRHIEKTVMLDAIDRLWVRHLTALESLRTGIGLRAYGQQDPLVAYKRESHDMYDMLVSSIQETIVNTIYRVDIAPVRQQHPRNLKATQANFDGAGSAPKKLRPIKANKKPGRNDPCWCGSGKKYKKCHEKEDRQIAKS